MLFKYLQSIDIKPKYFEPKKKDLFFIVFVFCSILVYMILINLNLQRPLKIIFTRVSLIWIIISMVSFHIFFKSMVKKYHYFQSEYSKIKLLFIAFSYIVFQIIYAAIVYYLYDGNIFNKNLPFKMIPIYIILNPLITALIEEWLFRFLFFVLFEYFFSEKLVFLISGLVFFLIHAIVLKASADVFVASFMVSWVFLKSRSLIACVLFHFLSGLNYYLIMIFLMNVIN